MDLRVRSDFLGRDQKISSKHASDFERLQTYDRLKLRIKGKDDWKDIERKSKQLSDKCNV
jgi:hypothetical protein